MRPPSATRTGSEDWCSRGRSGRRSAIRGPRPGALDGFEPSEPAARASILTSTSYFAVDASDSFSAAGTRRLQKGSRSTVEAAGDSHAR